MICTLKPVCKEYIWGGTALKEKYGKKYEGKTLAETWELSCHKNGLSIIADGENKNKTLKEVLEENPKWIGNKAEKEFPILIKLINSEKPLSVQVHPDEQYARVHEGQHGKTEMWYILEAKAGAGIYYGFEKEITRMEFNIAIREQSLCDKLHWVSVKPGDVFFIRPGTIHAIGAGITIVEVQQSSDITYRIYDYGRKDASGKERRLHVKEAGAVTRLCPASESYNFDGHMVKCNWFCVDYIEIKGSIKLYADTTSFHSLICIEGSATVAKDDRIVCMKKGTSIFVSAGEGIYEVKGVCKVIITSL